MRNFIPNLLNPSVSDNENPLRYYRERSLNFILLTAVILGTVVFCIKLYNSIQIGAMNLGILLSVAYFGILLIALIRKIPFMIRVIVALCYLYGLGLANALQLGPTGETFIWLFCITIFSNFYIGGRAGLISTLLNTGTLMIIGLGVGNNWLPSAISVGLQRQWANGFWIYPTLIYFVLGLISILAINITLTGLDKSLQDAANNIQELITIRDSLQSRSSVLERREIQVQTAAQISRTISTQLDPEKLLSQVVDLIVEKFGLYYVGVFLLDQDGDFAALKAGTGEAGRAMVEAGHKLPVAGPSMIGWAISRQKTRIALDVGEDAVRFDNPNLPNTRSELAIPMIYGDKVVGGITIQSDASNAFDENNIFVLQGIADSLAIAYENARLFQQIGNDFDEIQSLNKRLLSEEWTEAMSTESELSYSVNRMAIDNDQSRSLMMIDFPIILRDQVIGNIGLEIDKQTWSPEDESFTEAVAAQTALALENTRLMEATQRSARHNRVVAEFSNKVWESTDMDTILRTTLYQLVEALQATNGYIQLEIPEKSEAFVTIRQ
jgi:GAF domain-containing protein